MERMSYLAMLVATVLGSFWLEIVFKIGVLRRFKRLWLSLIPVAIVFLAWDAYAIAHKQWSFDNKQMLGVVGPLHIPLEEYVFFLVIPIAAIMTLEGVRSVKKHWPVGDNDDL